MRLCVGAFILVVEAGNGSAPAPRWSLVASAGARERGTGVGLDAVTVLILFLLFGGPTFARRRSVFLFIVRAGLSRLLGLGRRRNPLLGIFDGFRGLFLFRNPNFVLHCGQATLRPAISSGMRQHLVARGTANADHTSPAIKDIGADFRLVLRNVSRRVYGRRKQIARVLCETP